MNLSRTLILNVLALCLLSGVPVTTSAGDKQVVGYIERARLNGAGFTIEAKVDTGADTSSLHCRCVTPITKNGQRWVQFTVANEAGDTLQIEKPVVRVTKIKRHGDEDQERFVIQVGICLGKTYRLTEATLTDRSKFEYSMLIGRQYLQNDFLVDPGARFVTEPNCKSAPGKG